MLGVLRSRLFSKEPEMKVKTYKRANNLAQGELNTEYVVKHIDTEDGEMKDFLFTLGCYEGEQVTIISRLAGNVVISVKDARYSIDTDLAAVIAI